MNPPLIMPFSELYRINHYREALRSYPQTTNTHNHDSQSHPPPDGGSGDKQGSSKPRHGQTGDGGGGAASGVTSVTSSPTIISDEGGEKAAGSGLEQFSVKSSHSLLILEGVNENVDGADATMRDELIMMAHYDPIWREELRRYMHKEEKERQQMQKERVVRLDHWLEDMAVKLT